MQRGHGSTVPSTDDRVTKRNAAVRGRTAGDGPDTADETEGPRGRDAGGSALGQVAGLLLGDEQLLLGVDEGVALVVGELVVLLEVDGVLGAGLLAHAAEDAAQHVDLVA